MLFLDTVYTATACASELDITCNTFAFEHEFHVADVLLAGFLALTSSWQVSGRTSTGARARAPKNPVSYLNGAATRKPSKRAATQRSTKMSSLGEPATAMTHLSYKEATHEGEAWAALWSPFGDSTDLPPQTVGLQPELHDLPQKSSEKSHPGGDPRTPERTGTQGPPGPSYAAGDARPFEPEWSVLIDVTAFQPDVLAVSRQRRRTPTTTVTASLQRSSSASHAVTRCRR